MSIGDLAAGAVDRFINAGAPSRAEAVARMYARLRSRDAEAWVLWARAALASQGLVEMLRILHKAYLRLPGSLSILNELSSALNANGDHDESRRLLKEVEKRFPDAVETHVGFADLAVHEHEWSEAKGHAALAEERLRSSENAELQYDLASVVLAIPGERKWARRLLAQATLWNPNHALAHLLLALVSDDQSEAEDRFRQARATWRGSELWLLERERELREILS